MIFITQGKKSSLLNIKNNNNNFKNVAKEYYK